MQRNPFRYGAPVESESFCDRATELAALTERMRSGIHAFVLSPRRYGKTSLVLAALDRLRAEGGRGGYANLLLCTTEDEVASVILTAIAREVLRPVGRVRRTVEDVVRHLRVAPTVSFNPNGAVSFALDPRAGPTSWLDVLVDAIGLLEGVAARRGAALVLDEFQQIEDIGPKGLGGVFKALADQTRRSSLVFCGSHLAVMERLTRSPGAPLLGMGETFRIEAIPGPEMVAHLVARAASQGKQLSEADAGLIYALADGVPNDVQWLAHAAYEAAGSARTVGPADVDAGLGIIVAHQASGFAERYEALSPVQQRLLRELAGGPIRQIYGRPVLEALRVANANAVTKAIRALSDRELVRRAGGAWTVANPFFRRWILDGLAGG